LKSVAAQRARPRPTKENQMIHEQMRGSEKLMAAYNARTISEEGLKEIAEALDRSPAKLEGADVVGGEAATGVSLALSYSGDDVPMCGNDILFWLKWHQVHGGKIRKPRFIIDGIPFPDLIRVELDFGHVGPEPIEMPQIDGQAFGG
jgi:hypothetical protein